MPKSPVHVQRELFSNCLGTVFKSAFVLRLLMKRKNKIWSTLKSQFQSTETMLQWCGGFYMLPPPPLPFSQYSAVVFSICLSVFSSLCVQSFSIRRRRWHQVLRGRRKQRCRAEGTSPDPKILYPQLLIESNQVRRFHSKTQAWSFFNIPCLLYTKFSKDFYVLLVLK